MSVWRTRNSPKFLKFFAAWISATDCVPGEGFSAASCTWSTWYAYANWETLLKEISKSAAEQSAAVLQSQGSGFSKQLQEQMQKVMGR
jgi:hypothetical protein